MMTTRYSHISINVNANACPKASLRGYFDWSSYMEAKEIIEDIDE